MSIGTKLDVEIEDELDKLASMDMGSEQYRITVEGVTKLMDRSLELDKFQAEQEEKKRLADKDKLQAKEDKKDRLIKNGIAIGSILIPTIVTIWGTCVSLKFEETGSITTTMGRGFLGRLLPRK